SHFRGRVGDGEALTYRAANGRCDLLRRARQLIARERLSLRRADERLGVGDLDVRSLREQRDDEQQQCDQGQFSHWAMALATSLRSSSGEIGPTYFATIFPWRFRKKVSGTPPTP